ncbi:Cysteine-rich protein 1 [Smittium mucronatum]|uniref:Cysteine-rich protein 1 n=1 Tax=Smittium mucronatum TaxID=133383 RepID=A0A1R0H808_9FUNG|nr:Cysteine-rich protein 1 [Smittium mucronatum]
MAPYSYDIRVTGELKDGSGKSGVTKVFIQLRKNKESGFDNGSSLSTIKTGSKNFSNGSSPSISGNFNEDHAIELEIADITNHSNITPKELENENLQVTSTVDNSSSVIAEEPKLELVGGGKQFDVASVSSINKDVSDKEDPLFNVKNVSQKPFLTNFSGTFKIINLADPEIDSSLLQTGDLDKDTIRKKLDNFVRESIRSISRSVPNSVFKSESPFENSDIQSLADKIDIDNQIIKDILNGGGDADSSNIDVSASSDIDSTSNKTSLNLFSDRIDGLLKQYFDEDELKEYLRVLNQKHRFIDREKSELDDVLSKTAPINDDFSDIPHTPQMSLKEACQYPMPYSDPENELSEVLSRTDWVDPKFSNGLYYNQPYPSQLTPSPSPILESRLSLKKSKSKPVLIEKEYFFANSSPVPKSDSRNSIKEKENINHEHQNKPISKNLDGGSSNSITNGFSPKNKNFNLNTNFDWNIPNSLKVEPLNIQSEFRILSETPKSVYMSNIDDLRGEFKSLYRGSTFGIDAQNNSPSLEDGESNNSKAKNSEAYQNVPSGSDSMNNTPSQFEINPDVKKSISNLKGGAYKYENLKENASSSGSERSLNKQRSSPALLDYSNFMTNFPSNILQKSENNSPSLPNSPQLHHSSRTSSSASFRPLPKIPNKKREGSSLSVQAPIFSTRLTPSRLSLEPQSPFINENPPKFTEKTNTLANFKDDGTIISKKSSISFQDNYSSKKEQLYRSDSASILKNGQNDPSSYYNPMNNKLPSSPLLNGGISAQDSSYSVNSDHPNFEEVKQQYQRFYKSIPSTPSNAQSPVPQNFPVKMNAPLNETNLNNPPTSKQSFENQSAPLDSKETPGNYTRNFNYSVNPSSHEISSSVPNDQQSSEIEFPKPPTPVFGKFPSPPPGATAKNLVNPEPNVLPEAKTSYSSISSNYRDSTSTLMDAYRRGKLSLPKEDQEGSSFVSDSPKFPVNTVPVNGSESILIPDLKGGGLKVSDVNSACSIAPSESISSVPYRDELLSAYFKRYIESNPAIKAKNEEAFFCNSCSKKLNSSSQNLGIYSNRMICDDCKEKIVNLGNKYTNSRKSFSNSIENHISKDEISNNISSNDFISPAKSTNINNLRSPTTSKPTIRGGGGLKSPVISSGWRFGEQNTNIFPSQSFENISDFVDYMHNKKNYFDKTDNAMKHYFELTGNVDNKKEKISEQERTQTPSGTEWLTEREIRQEHKTHVLEKKTMLSSPTFNKNGSNPYTDKNPPIKINSGHNESNLGDYNSIRNESIVINGYNQPLCPRCNKVVYPTDKISFEGYQYHRPCLKCKECQSSLRPHTAVQIGDGIYCNNHAAPLLRRHSKLLSPKRSKPLDPTNDLSFSRSKNNYGVNHTNINSDSQYRSKPLPMRPISSPVFSELSSNFQHLDPSINNPENSDIYNQTRARPSQLASRGPSIADNLNLVDEKNRNMIKTNQAITVDGRVSVTSTFNPFGNDSNRVLNSPRADNRNPNIPPFNPIFSNKPNVSSPLSKHRYLPN